MEVDSNYRESSYSSKGRADYDSADTWERCSGWVAKQDFERDRIKIVWSEKEAEVYVICLSGGIS